MFSFFRKAKKIAPKPFDFSKNRFPARSTWPPTFDDLSNKEKFKLERTFRRRAKLKWARPGWNKGLILFQWAAISSVIGYATLYMDWSNGPQGQEQDLPEFVRSIRRWYFGIADGIWEKSSSMTSRSHVEMMHDRLLEQENAKSKST
jgi:hypothetical protein